MGTIKDEIRQNAAILLIAGAGIAGTTALLYLGQAKDPFNTASQKIQSFSTCLPTGTRGYNANLRIDVASDAPLTAREEHFIANKLYSVVSGFSAADYYYNIPRLQIRASQAILRLNTDLNLPIRVSPGPLTPSCT